MKTLFENWRWLATTLAVGLVVAGSLVIHRFSRAPVPRSGTDAAIETPVVRINLPAEPDGAFAGSASCRRCHEDICRTYDQHPMGRSASLASVDTSGLTEEQLQFDVPVTPGRPNFYRYSVQRSEGSMWHIETSLSVKGGEPVYEKKVQADYAIGSGKRGKSYLINCDGVLLMSPITWYSQGKRWDLSPGTDQRNLHFTRRIVDGCVLCHVSRPVPKTESINLFEKEPFAELPIGCERCHGPGEDHIKFHDRMLTSASDPIINPKHLSANKRDDVCFQCHLIGESRIPRFGRTDFTFRPGDSLEDHWTIFLRSAAGIDEENRTEAVSQVEQMLNSTCYKKSGGNFGCSTCHDPHRVPEESQLPTFYNDKCLSCHRSDTLTCRSTDSSNREPLSNCIQCHMPSIAANDVPHTSQTDHRLLRQPDKTTKPKKGHQVEFTIFRSDSQTTPQDELDRAQAIQMVRTAEATNKSVFAVDAISILERWTKVNPDDFAATEALGSAYLLLQDNLRAESIWKASLKMRPTDERFLRRLFFLYHDQNQLVDASKIARRLLEVNACDFEVHGRFAHILGQLGHLEEAIQHAETAVELNPSSYEIYDWLANATRAAGDEEKSVMYQSKFKALQPASK